MSMAQTISLLLDCFDIESLILTSNRSSSSTSLSWTDFFSQELFLTQDNNNTNIRIIHHVYLTPPSKSGPLFVMHHGAGSSGLSFAACAEEIRKIVPKAGILSLDIRDHGSTQVTKIDTSGGDDSKVDTDLALETLSNDLIFVINETQSRMGWETLPDIVLVGHSLGGAVITDVAKKGVLGQKLLAYAVLDVVEGIDSSYLSFTFVWIIDRYSRIRNGSSPEHGKIPRYPSNPLPFLNIGNRMAVCFPFLFSLHPKDNDSHKIAHAPVQSETEPQHESPSLHSSTKKKHPPT